MTYETVKYQLRTPLRWFAIRDTWEEAAQDAVDHEIGGWDGIALILMVGTRIVALRDADIHREGLDV